ncbi:S1 family peptidase [Echinimonas agarilytica]|uniref:Serine protease n=1 Tax=Echinimonas agarilytica TaxID=1215918 RepID=A0AA41W5L8_9GAMM|nr:serine protease [Echinimonas agarilytica]MCM2678898.1 serine protease [Echinimonas agarilytica]
MIQLIESVKPSIVGVGLYDPLAAPKATLMATGFAVAGGDLIATNAHAVPELDPSRKQNIAVLLPGRHSSRVYEATLVAKDEVHDLAILRIRGHNLPPLTLSNMEVKEGLDIAFTGFPIGTMLGLHPVTHKGMIASIAPVMLPVANVSELTAAQLKILRNPYSVFQLNATAYPGNSGSPVYDVDSGEVVAIINKVLLTSNKESALTHPSAITYSVPVKHLKELLRSIR